MNSTENVSSAKVEEVVVAEAVAEAKKESSSESVKIQKTDESQPIQKAESKHDPTNRPYGYFKPKPELVGYLFGTGGKALRSLAQRVGEGAYIRFNDATGNFDIWARSATGVLRVRRALWERQKAAPIAGSQPSASTPEGKVKTPATPIRPRKIRSTSEATKQTIKIGSVTITITQEAGDTPINVDLVSKVSEVIANERKPVVRRNLGPEFERIVPVAEANKTTYSSVVAKGNPSPIKRILSKPPTINKPVETELRQASIEVPRPTIAKKWGDYDEKDNETIGVQNDDVIDSSSESDSISGAD